MAVLLTILLMVMFTVQFITQFNPTQRRLITRRRIASGLMSNLDIVRWSHRRYESRHYSLLAYMPIDRLYSCRYHLSGTGRLYKYMVINGGHRSIEYISRRDAIDEIRYLTKPGLCIEEVETLVNPDSKSPVFHSQFIRPAFCSI